MKNKWKVLFFFLAGLNLLFLTIFLILVNLPVEKEDPAVDVARGGEPVQFGVNTNRADLNRLINHYIEEEGRNSPFDYSVRLKDEVELFGTMKVFTQDIEMRLTFEPEALENGDLVLKHKSISVGQLNLPVHIVLKFVKEQYDLPEWIVIQPHEEQIYVAMQELKLKSDTTVRVNKFDLKNDDIVFTLMVPTE